ncbi:copper-transporting ATPase HMA5 [Phlyctema vagabunda]|uniref:Copper-transporting ATPase HMA5 n=1 Tax=Phlyctema vagabunda TaxID=108571 RepID=A0ABR4PEC8_9HELO
MALSAPSPRGTIITTSYLVSNMHCPSCVSHIKASLSALQPEPTSISPSLVTSWITVQHDDALSSREILDALEDAGFDVCDVSAEDAASDIALQDLPSKPAESGGYLDQVMNRWTSRSSLNQANHMSRHVQNCKQCRLEAEGSPEDRQFSQSSALKQINSASTDGPINKTVPLVVVHTQEEDVWRASIAIGGMTCASCSGAITEELQNKSWIQKVVVNLISNSATVDFTGVAHEQDIVEAIEDIGYDASIDSVVAITQTKEIPGRLITSRTADIFVDGMFCDHCPPRVLAALATFGDRLEIVQRPSIRDPIVKVTYTPEAPHFSIRQILQAISSADNSLHPSIYHPPTLEERSQQMHRREQQRILIRVIVTIILAIPTLIIGIIFMSLVSSDNAVRKFFDAPLQAGVSRSQWALFIISTPVYFLCADVFHTRAIKEIRSLWRKGNKTPIAQRFYRFGSMNSLMSLGTSIAYFSSVAQLIAAAVHPMEMADNSSFYFDSVVFLTLFLLIGRLIESYSKSKTGDAVAMLGKLRPTEALLVEPSSDNTTDNEMTQGESLVTVNVDLLEFRDIVRVLHGGSPPCDGTVVQGETRFDESSLTGESRPVKKSNGDEVYSGTVNKGPPISIEITGVAGSSMLDQIVKAVREGQTKRAPMERIADALTGYFVPFIVFVAISTWITWLALGHSGKLPDNYLSKASGGWTAWSLQFAIAVFVVACPCGLALAAPTALFVGGGLAAKYGILVKGGGEAFEKASRLDCIVFDKTGTLTMGGEPVVTNYEISSEFISKLPSFSDENKILGLVRAIENNSSHTIAKAIVSFCKQKESVGLEVEEVEEIPGKGMKGTYHDKRTNERIEIMIGNEALVSDSRVIVNGSIQKTLDSWKSEGKSVAVAAVRSNNLTSDYSEWYLCAVFAVSDPIRPEAPQIIAALQKRGTDVWMLSGDNYLTASAIGSLVGIPSSNVIAGVLPSEKAEKIKYLQKSLKSGSSTSDRALVAMVGDGINDSPALATADVGIAIGSGSDIAISSASFVLITSNLNSLITLLDLSRVVFRRIKFNFGWALIYNMIALPVAAGVLYPVVSHGKHVRLDPVWASLAMALSSISVVCSSLALRSRIPGIGFKAR